jgi:copper oxidase (laccase) domain-containing protein
MGMWDLIQQWRSTAKHDRQGVADQGFSDNVGATHQADEIAGLDFRKAIDSHLQWKERLRAVVEGDSEEQLDLRQVARDDQCVLGKWIHGPGTATYGNSEQFASLRSHHANFHVCTAGILAEAQAGRTHEAKVQLTNTYAKASEAVKHDLIRLYLALSQH